MTKERIYQERFSVVRKFYENDTPGVNFCNLWYRSAKGREKAFLCSETVKLPGSGAVTMRTTFTAERKGTLLLGVGVRRHFKVFCNRVFCFSNAGEGTLYDELAPENHPFLVPVERGENLLEIEIEAGFPFAPFCCRPLEKSALKLPVVLFHPVVTRIGRNEATCVCRTAGAVGCGIQYKAENAQEWNLLWDQRGGLIRRRDLHKFFLKDLEENTVYHYRILMIDPRDPDVKRYSKVYSFRSAPAHTHGKFSFFFTADPQFPPAQQKKLLKALFEAGQVSECDFLVLGGDINSRYSQRRIERDLLSCVEKFGNPGAPLLMLRGNHELRGPEPDNFVDFWSGEDEKTFYMFRYGDTAFLVLDAWENRPADHPRARYYSRHNLDELIREEEKAFVDQIVNSPLWKNARRRIVFSHGSSFSQLDRAGTMYRFLQALTDEYFEGEKPVSCVHLLLAGHTHIYTRSIPGSDELASFSPGPAPDKSGKNYIFPAISCCGPNKKGLPLLSGVRVEGEENGDLRVRSILPDGRCFEEIIIHEDHSIEEITSLEHFLPVGEE